MGRREPESDSLELSLGTLCNAFGGIVFLALLVCLLTQGASGPSTVWAAAADVALSQLRDAKALKAHLDALVHEAATLQNLADRQLVEAKSSPAASGSTEMSRTYAELRVKRQLLRREEQELLAALEAKSGERDKATSGVLKATKGRESHQQAAAQADDQLVTERNSRAVHLRLPMSKGTSKRQVPVLVAGGRLRFPYFYSAHGVAGERNTADVLASAPEKSLKPEDLVPAGGIRIENKPDAESALMRRLKAFDNEATYIYIAVWPDSFHEFKMLRDVLVKIGFDYQVLIVEKDGAVLFGGGGDDTVQ